MKKFFIATSNAGKQKEIIKFSNNYGNDVTATFPSGSTEIKVDESGSTFEENALLKAQAYKDFISDDDYTFVGDDSGIVIPALNGEPGVFTRRWAGYEMTDEEILQYCMEKMKHLKGDQRKAIFETVLAAIAPDGEVKYYRGQMPGRILEKPLAVEAQPGFPFRSVFWVDEINLPIYELHALTSSEAAGFLTHRAIAFKQLFSDEK